MDYVHLAYIILFAVCTVAVRLKLRFTGLLLQLYKYGRWFNKLWFNRLFLHKCEKRKTKLVIKFKMLFHDKYLATFINLTTAKIMKKTTLLPHLARYTKQVNRNLKERNPKYERFEEGNSFLKRLNPFKLLRNTLRPYLLGI